MVVAAEEARRETVKRAVDILRAADTSVAGAVLNGLRASRRNYYYYYYYYDDRAMHKRRAWWTSAG
jgi:Mrp family chromosome partitioning ATPase